MKFGRAANKRKQMEQKIFEAGMKLFQEKGFNNTTLQDICQEAGVSKGTIFNYFTSKEDILARFGRGQIEILYKFAKKLPTNMNTKEKVIAVLLEDFRTVRESNVYTKIALKGIAEGGDPIAKLELQNRKNLAKIYENILRQGLKDKEKDPEINLSLVSDLIVTIYFHTLDKHFNLDECKESGEQFIRNSIDILFYGISEYVSD